MIIHIVHLFWLLSYLHPCVSNVVCKGLNGLPCCDGFVGYVWNETVHNCTSCMSGFYGANCSLPCPHPLYGFWCFLECVCSQEDCHHQHGCRRNPGDCDPGVYGPYCNLVCPYPGFGKGCQETCGCEKHDCDPTTGCILEWSSPVGEPIEEINETYPLSTSNEHLNELAGNDNPCDGKMDTSHIKRSKVTLEYTIIGLGVISCVFMIFYIGLCIVPYIYRPKETNGHGRKRQINVTMNV